MAEPRALFYHDVAVAEGERLVAQLQTQSLKTLFEGGEHAYAGWMDGCAGLVLGHDRGPGVSRFCADNDGPDGEGAGADITVREVASGHSPMLSKPEETVDFILEAYFTR